MRQKDVDKILEIGVLLSSERDLNRLLEKILSSVMELTRCNAGTLYLLDGDSLRFKIMRNDTLGKYEGGDGRDPNLPPVPLDREHVCSLALLENRTIVVDDVKNCREYDFSGHLKYDDKIGYHTRSILVVPMRNREGEKIGVLQMINAMDGQGNICPFPEDTVLLVESVASQAAITIQNVRYIRAIKGLFQSFVRVMSSAVDERTPYNGNHTRHMAACGEKFIDYLNENARSRGEKEPFSKDHREELLMSIWFHDIGKLVTPLEVMNKESRLLPPQRREFLHRMETIRLLAKVEYVQGNLTAEEYDKVTGQTREAEAFVEAVDKEDGYVTDEMMAQLKDLRDRTYTGEDGKTCPWLSREEYDMLSIRRGNLSPEERGIMEEHVVITDKLLSQIQFSPELSHVREWAAAHHEALNGMGYPKGKKGTEIPMEVRIITILDIFDALVAADRPYKKGKSVEEALGILMDGAEKGRLDKELTQLFADSRCWKK